MDAKKDVFDSFMKYLVKQLYSQDEKRIFNALECQTDKTDETLTVIPGERRPPSPGEVGEVPSKTQEFDSHSQ